MLGLFARWLFASEIAGLFGALLLAIMPGSFFYGRTFTPDTTMVFFLTCALYVISRMLIDEETWSPRTIAAATGLLALAFLAKPVSVVALVPLGALIIERARSGRTLRWGPIALILAIPLALLYGYDRAVASHAEWHWASGITTLHVLPDLAHSMRSGAALNAKMLQFRQALGMLAYTMIGPALSALGILGFVFLPASTRTRTLLWSWLAGGLAYVYVVVTVERVDYYMYLLLPLAALTGAGFLTRLTSALQRAAAGRTLTYAAAAAGLLALAAVVYQNRKVVEPYYSTTNRCTAMQLRSMRPSRPEPSSDGHYHPSVLYYIGRYGWEEDPYLWTPFDEQSAIRKGARYFIAIEKNRFNAISNCAPGCSVSR